VQQRRQTIVDDRLVANGEQQRQQKTQVNTQRKHRRDDDATRWSLRRRWRPTDCSVRRASHCDTSDNNRSLNHIVFESKTQSRVRVRGTRRSACAARRLSTSAAIYRVAGKLERYERIKTTLCIRENVCKRGAHAYGAERHANRVVARQRHHLLRRRRRSSGMWLRTSMYSHVKATRTFDTYVNFINCVEPAKHNAMRNVNDNATLARANSKHCYVWNALVGRRAESRSASTLGLIWFTNDSSLS
jgi:hypothetical protein